MGLGGISIWQLLIILAIVVLIFGTKKLKNVGNDLGSAMKSFRSAVHDSDAEEERKRSEEERASLASEPESSANTAQREKADETKKTADHHQS